MKREIFFPIVGVTDGQYIDVDFSDSYDHTHDEAFAEVEPDMTETEETSVGAALLDTLVAGDSSVPEKLRRLADYIEQHPREESK